MTMLKQTFVPIDVMVSDVGLLVYEQIRSAYPTVCGHTKVLNPDDVVMMCAYLSVPYKMLRMTTWQVCIALVIPEWYDTDGEHHMLLRVVKESHDCRPGYYLVNVSNRTGSVIADVAGRWSNMPLRALRDHHVVIESSVVDTARRGEIIDAGINAALRRRQQRESADPCQGRPSQSHVTGE
jgi:hypothetical protein